MGGLVTLLIILSIFFGPIIFLRVWSNFTHTHWQKGSKPDINGVIIDVKSKKAWCGGPVKIKTTILFSDGFVYTTYESYRVDYNVQYKLSIDNQLYNYILRCAEDKHEEAVQKK